MLPPSISAAQTASSPTPPSILFFLIETTRMTAASITREMSICFLMETNRKERRQHRSRLLFDSVQKYFSRAQKNSIYRGIASPSVRMLLEYMEERAAAKRHSKETAIGIQRRIRAVFLEKPILFHSVFTRHQAANAARTLCRKAAASR